MAAMEIIKENFAKTEDCAVYLVLDGRKASDNTLLYGLLPPSNKRVRK